jgi:hypothetical protein
MAERRPPKHASVISSFTALIDKNSYTKFRYCNPATELCGNMDIHSRAVCFEGMTFSDEVSRLCALLVAEHGETATSRKCVG